MFLSILAHHTKNRIVKKSYRKSGRTVSKHFHGVLNAIIRLHSLLLAKPVPIDEDCTNERWKWFKDCLGALDGTYIPVKVSKFDRGRYRNRKGQISVNVLGVCDRYMNFTYVLTGWERSAADARVLWDAIMRNNRLRVPIGFLTPYHGLRYHLDDWVQGRYAPQNKKELFNMKHSKARAMDGESSCRDSSKGNVTSNRRRIWTLKEEEVLVQALKDLVQQKDPNARTLRHKSFPFFHSWCEIFGKDRATGENVEDFNSADNDQLDVDMHEVNEPVEKYSKDASDGDDDVVSICKTSGEASSKKTKSKKRKLVDTTGEKIVDLMGTFCNQTNE
ncbi:hypothetical protein C2S53_010257 [Perilla frutescens var. hirtella]|uniref:DUF8040 domain-containing protein n=1 Tax=Perilla frutescens var. hirtella TaxID=608512 RepID=A0AAD4NZT4_PERFH|nr:hypothetical protein C2S53_010257 [Perilla frutescens var. hirtella]